MLGSMANAMMERAIYALYGFTIFNVANPEATLDPTTREQRFTR